LRSPQPGSENYQTFAPGGCWQTQPDALATQPGAKGDRATRRGRFAEGERTMSEVELPNLYEPAGDVAEEPVELRHLVDQLAAVVAAA